MKLKDITEDDFIAYEEVRVGGRFNMFDPNARRLTGLDKDIYVGIMDHYTELTEKFPGVRK